MSRKLHRLHKPRAIVDAEKAVVDAHRNVAEAQRGVTEAEYAHAKALLQVRDAVRADVSDGRHDRVCKACARLTARLRALRRDLRRGDAQ